MDAALTELIAALRLEKVADRRYQARHVRAGGGRVVYGGQLLAQMIMAAADTVPDKSVKSLHAMFVKGASLDEPAAVGVEVMHTGRMYSSVTVDIRQGNRLCARALVLLDREDKELARHAMDMPVVAGPDSAGRSARASGGAEVRLVGNVDLDDADQTGPPHLQIWARFEGAPPEEAVNRALLAFATEPYFFGTALRPHEGLSQSMAYREFIPAVISHSIFFHGAFSAAEWLLFDLHSPHLGRGRIFGYGSVFTGEGELVSSITQENQLRPIRKP